jgi:signal transduction histidine kinase
MKKLVSILIVLAMGAVFFLAPAAFADEKADAVQMVKEAVAYYNANGLEKALDTYNDVKGPFVKGELYVIAFTFDGTLVANAPKQNLVGQNLLEVPDSDGNKFRKAIVELAKQGTPGWVDYKTQNPKTKTIEQKTTYVERAGELAIGCGIYKK